jgi:hypothetical protein
MTNEMDTLNIGGRMVEHALCHKVIVSSLLRLEFKTY